MILTSVGRGETGDVGSMALLWRWRQPPAERTVALEHERLDHLPLYWHRIDSLPVEMAARLAGCCSTLPSSIASSDPAIWDG